MNEQKIIKAVETLMSRVDTIGGRKVDRSFVEYKVVSAFRGGICDSITLSVFISAPVSSEGYATIYRDGRLVMRVA